MCHILIVQLCFYIHHLEIIGERMTKRIRGDYFRALLRQNIGWFDLPENALGVLTSRLAVDIKLIRLCVGKSLPQKPNWFCNCHVANDKISVYRTRNWRNSEVSTMSVLSILPLFIIYFSPFAIQPVSSMTSLLVGFVVSMIAAWQFALAFLATVPLLALTEMINWALMKGGDSNSKKKLAEISGLFGEYVSGESPLLMKHTGQVTSRRSSKMHEPAMLYIFIL